MIGDVESKAPFQNEPGVPLLLRLTIPLVLLVGTIAYPVMVFLPLGIPQFIVKKCGGPGTISGIIGMILSFISYGAVIGLLITMLQTSNIRTYIRVLAMLCVVLLLNFASCSTAGPFIEG